MMIARLGLPGHHPGQLGVPLTTQRFKSVAQEMDTPDKRIQTYCEMYRSPDVRLAALFFTKVFRAREVLDGLVGWPLLGTRVKGLFVKSSPLIFPDHYLDGFKPFERIRFDSIDKKNLEGCWMPARQENPKFPKTTVVMGHGYGGDWRSLLPVAEAFRQAGINCFLFDFRDHGRSERWKTSFGFHEGKDIAGAVDFVREKYGDKAENIFYYGHSMGAAAFLMTPDSLKQHPMPKQIKGAILDAPYANFKVVAERFLKLMSQFKLLEKHVNVDNLMNGLSLIGQDYLNLPFPLWKMQPWRIASQPSSPLLEVPMVILHSKDDDTTPYTESVQNYQALKRAGHPKVWSILMDGANHMFGWMPDGKQEIYITSQRTDTQTGKTISDYGLTFMEAILAQKTPDFNTIGFDSLPKESDSKLDVAA